MKHASSVILYRVFKYLPSWPIVPIKERSEIETMSVRSNPRLKLAWPDPTPPPPPRHHILSPLCWIPPQEEEEEK